MNANTEVSDASSRGATTSAKETMIQAGMLFGAAAGMLHAPYTVAYGALAPLGVANLVLLSPLHESPRFHASVGEHESVKTRSGKCENEN